MTMNKQKRILIIAGESSGDQHAARYVREHEKMNPDIIFDAFGQKELKSTALILFTILKRFLLLELWKLFQNTKK